MNSASGEGEVPPLTSAVAEGHREVALVLMEHGASCSDATLTRPMLKDLTKWMAGAMKQNTSVVNEKNRQMEQMLQESPSGASLTLLSRLSSNGRYKFISVPYCQNGAAVTILVTCC